MKQLTLFDLFDEAESLAREIPQPHRISPKGEIKAVWVSRFQKNKTRFVFLGGRAAMALTGAARSAPIACSDEGKAVLEKQSNLSYNITASNEISAEPQAEPQKYISSPMYLQFLSIKKQYPDALLLFRCGDFYEAYEQDAQDATKILGVTLTHRGTMPMCGFPYHALDTYLPRLVRAGRRVAICDLKRNSRTKNNPVNCFWSKCGARVPKVPTFGT